MLKIELIYFEAGGGHRSAALALRDAIRQEGYDWDVRLVNLQDVLAPIDVIGRLTGIRLHDGYNAMMRRSWTLGLRHLIPALHALIRLYHEKEVALFAEHWKASQPDLVVSVVSHFNRALCEGAARGAPDVPFVTVMTDLADYPPHMWLERQTQYVICGTERAASQAREAGIPPNMILRSSGMIVHPRFYEAVTLDRAEERRKWGLEESLPTGLVLFGGEGSQSMLEIARRVNDSRLAAQWIFICGRNQKLTEKLLQFPSHYRKHVMGFTTEVPYYMRLADFFVGKPGPGSISEALVMGLPVIVEDNVWTMPHERYNAQWIREQGVGVPVEKMRQIASAVSGVLEPESFGRFKANIQAMNNRAVFEAPRFFSKILGTAGTQADRISVPEHLP